MMLRCLLCYVSCYFRMRYGIRQIQPARLQHSFLTHIAHLLKLQDNQNSCHLNRSIDNFGWIRLLKWTMHILKWRCKVVGSVIILQYGSTSKPCIREVSYRYNSHAGGASSSSSPMSQCNSISTCTNQIRHTHT